MITNLLSQWKKLPTGLRILLGTGLLFLLTACAPKVMPPVAPQEAPPEVAMQLLDRLAVYGEAFNSLKGLAKVKVEFGEKSFAVNQVVLAQKPNRLRAETLGLFGTPAALMTADGSALAVFVPGESTFYRGSASFDNIQRFTRVPLRLEELVPILLYQVPVVRFNDRQVLLSGEGGYLMILSSGDGRSQELAFDAGTRLHQVRFLKDEKLLLQIDYEQFTEADPPFPRESHLQMPEYQAEARIEFSDVALNDPIPPELFRLAVPVGVTIIELDDQIRDVGR